MSEKLAPSLNESLKKITFLKRFVFCKVVKPERDQDKNLNLNEK